MIPNSTRSAEPKRSSASTTAASIASKFRTTGTASSRCTRTGSCRTPGPTVRCCESGTRKAFDDLVAWVHKNVQPEGDEVYGDLSNAGMKFTEPLRPNDPGTLRIAPASTILAAAQAVAKVEFGRDVQPILRRCGRNANRASACCSSL